MSKEEEKSMKRLEILGSTAGILLILAAVAAFFLQEIVQQMMAFAVACGIIVNVVCMTMAFRKGKTLRSIFFMIFSIVLVVLFVMQIMCLR